MRERAEIRPEEKGHAFIELAIVLPVLLIISLAGLEFALRFRHHQLSVALSRELASKIYRYCIADYKVYKDADSTSFNPKQCVEDVASEFGSEFQNASPGMIHLASVYTWNTDDNSIKEEICRMNGSTPCSSSYPTKFSTQIFEDKLEKNASKDLVEDFSSIIVGEVYIPYQSTIGTLDFLIGHSGRMYGATII